MTRVLADQIYSALHDNGDGTYRALCREGWHVAHPGDVLNFSGGTLVTVDGPSQIGGGSVKACVAAVAIGIGVLVAAGCFDVGKGFGL